MNYYQIPQKYTYANQAKTMTMVKHSQQGYNPTGNCYAIDSTAMHIDIDYPAQQPPSEMPKRNYRVSDAIKVTTWHGHGKIQLELNDFVMNPTGQGYQAYANWPWNSQMFINMRLFAVEVDVAEAFNPLVWFKDVHNWVAEIPNSTTGDPALPVYTIHEKMLRKTTTWTGRYKVLIDRPFKITSRSTNLDFQIDIPFNRRFEWPEGAISGKPRIPNIYIVIMGPMSSLDVDQQTASRIFNSRDGDTTERPVINVQLFKKLNFIDL